MPINPVPLSKKGVNNDQTVLNKKNSQTMIDFMVKEPIYTFKDMVLSKETFDKIQDALAIFQYRDKVFDEWKLSSVIKKPSNLCLNLYGESGTGKTMAANAIASQLNFKLLQVNYADIESKYVGETSKNLVHLFQSAKDKNSLILFDEADALLSKRVTDMSSATDVSVNQTRSVLLTLLDGFSGMVIFTTNFISNYDSAFMRRIPYHIKFNLPDKRLRQKLLEHYLLGTVPNNIVLEEVATKFTGINGSDIANATLVSALKTARENKKVLDQKDFEEALKSIVESKNNNRSKIVKIEEKEVSEAYALSQIRKASINSDNNKV